MRIVPYIYRSIQFKIRSRRSSQLFWSELFLNLVSLGFDLTRFRVNLGDKKRIRSTLFSHSANGEKKSNQREWQNYRVTFNLSLIYVAARGICQGRPGYRAIFHCEGRQFGRHGRHVLQQIQYRKRIHSLADWSKYDKR